MSWCLSVVFVIFGDALAYLAGSGCCTASPGVTLSASDGAMDGSGCGWPWSLCRSAISCPVYWKSNFEDCHCLICDGFT